ncbi:MAG TPA: DUF1858 domain-containing protein [Chloroflexi bacterium]|nr:DUF1858 domain-containing protein [Chloroflexota bacterium]
MEITADINVEELVVEFPEAIGFLADRGIVCIRCGEPYWGTLRELARTKNLDGQIDEIVRDLQAYLKEEAAD